MVTDKEKYSEKVFEHGQDLEDLTWQRCQWLLDKLLNVLPYGCGMLDSPQKSENLSCPPHLDVDIMSGSLGGVIFGVQGQILDQSQHLNEMCFTVSLLEVLASRPRKVLRYDINSSD